MQGYLKRKDKLPDPKESLSLFLPSSAITAANHEIMEVTSKDSKKCGVRTGDTLQRDEVRCSYR